MDLSPPVRVSLSISCVIPTCGFFKKKQQPAVCWEDSSHPPVPSVALPLHVDGACHQEEAWSDPQDVRFIQRKGPWQKLGKIARTTLDSLDLLTFLGSPQNNTDSYRFLFWIPQSWWMFLFPKQSQDMNDVRQQGAWTCSINLGRPRSTAPPKHLEAARES